MRPVAQKTNQWKLGLFVVATLALGLAAVFWLGVQRLNRDAVPAVTYFDESVQGLDVGSPVKFRGVVIGTVSEIGVAPDHRHVEVWMRIYVEELRRLGLDAVRPAEAELRPQIAAAGITGVKFVQFDQFPTSRYPIPDLPFAVPERYYVPAVPSTLKSFEEIANEFLVRLPTLADDVRDAVVEAKKSLRTLSDLARWAQSDETGLKSTVAAFRTAAQSFEAAVARAELATTTKSVREAAVGVQGAAGKFAVQSDQLEATLVTLREALEAVRALVARLERDPSSLLRGRSVADDRPKENRP